MRRFVSVLACLSAGATAEAASLAIDRQPEQGGMVIGRTEPGCTLFVDGSEVRTAADGHFILGFGRGPHRLGRAARHLPGRHPTAPVSAGLRAKLAGTAHRRLAERNGDARCCHPRSHSRGCGAGSGGARDRQRSGGMARCADVARGRHRHRCLRIAPGAQRRATPTALRHRHRRCRGDARARGGGGARRPLRNRSTCRAAPSLSITASACRRAISISKRFPSHPATRSRKAMSSARSAPPVARRARTWTGVSTGTRRVSIPSARRDRCPRNRAVPARPTAVDP